MKLDLKFLGNAKHRLQILNAGLRMVPLAAKFLLTLYMGRYFSLAEIGVYGLVMGAVAILSVIFGQNFVYVVNRDIIGTDDATVLHKIRDETYLYLANYAVMAVGTLVLIATHLTDIDTRTYLYILILTVLEGLGTVFYGNLNSLHQQILANALFLVRAGAWIVPAIILCIIFPGLRNADTILIGWTIGAAASIALTFWSWRGMPWREVMSRPIDWPWLVRGTKTAMLIWLGMIGIALGSYVDRFVVEHYLKIEDVGVLTFYFSFTNALMTLMVSGVAAFSTPRMVLHHRNKDHASFAQEAGNARRQVALSAGVISCGMGIAIPILGHFLGRPAFVSSMHVLWLMLLATWIRVNADILSNMLYARHQDRAVWLGNLLFLVPAIGCNLLFVPWLGMIGIGYGGVVAAVFLFSWRWWYAHNFKHKEHA